VFRGGSVPCGPTFTPTSTITPTNTPVCQVQMFSTDVPKAIPDVSTVTSYLIFSGVDTISKVNLTGLNITHTYIGDLIVTLTSPAGTTVTLINQVCNTARFQNFNNITLDDNAAAAIGSVCPPAANAT